jgi:digeranylgeranylglycerophospholipid reductase
MLDVAIVGGGPGGLSAARRLAADGWSVTVFEEHDRIGAPVHCTGVLAEDVIAAMDLPAEAVLNPLETVRFVAPAGHSFDYTTATTEAVVIDREVFDSALARRAERAGATRRRRA